MLIHRYIYFPVLLLFFLILLVQDLDNPDEICESPMPAKVMAPSKNAIYYWKTTFDPTEFEKDFYEDHNIGKMYIRMFDVDIKEDYLHDTITARPIATTVFKQKPPHNMEIVPTVFFTLPAIEICGNNPEEYSRRLIKRIDAMAFRYSFSNRIREIQFDCDWTASTEQAYFRFCKETARLLEERDLILSSTIRLHQLRQPAPPVARGALMLYNTGAFMDAKTTNSILDWKEAEPYIEKASYPLPLDFAYPTFSWNLLFRGDSFQYIIRDLGNKLTLQHYWNTVGNNMYAKTDFCIGENEIRKGDRVRTECPEFWQIKRVKTRAEQRLKDSQSNVIIYHSDSTNLSRYTHDEIDFIYGN